MAVIIVTSGVWGRILFQIPRQHIYLTLLTCVNRGGEGGGLLNRLFSISLDRKQIELRGLSTGVDKDLSLKG